MHEFLDVGGNSATPILSGRRVDPNRVREVFMKRL